MRLLLLLYMLPCILCAVAQAKDLTPVSEKIIVVKIDEKGFITDGIDTISSDELAYYIEDRLFKTYKSTGKMYDRIKIEKSSDNIPSW